LVVRSRCAAALGSPSPRLQLGTTAVGIQTSEGVVLAAEKRISSKLLVPSSVKKLVQLDARTCAERGATSATAMAASMALRAWMHMRCSHAHHHAALLLLFLLYALRL
jgi:hypothetical protein